MVLILLVRFRRIWMKETYVRKVVVSFGEPDLYFLMGS